MPIIKLIKFCSRNQDSIIFAPLQIIIHYLKVSLLMCIINNNYVISDVNLK